MGVASNLSVIFHGKIVLLAEVQYTQIEQTHTLSTVKGENSKHKRAEQLHDRVAEFRSRD